MNEVKSPSAAGDGDDPGPTSRLRADIFHPQFWKDFGFFLAWGCVLTVVELAGLGQNWPWLSHLGGEYLHISKSLAETGNYSDPFTGPTGPTAWMPPLLPYLMATIRSIGGELILTITVCLAQFFVVSAVFAWLAGFARTAGIAHLGKWIILAFSIAEIHNLYGITHDSFFLLGLISFTVVWLDACWNPIRLRWRSACVWGLWGGLLALTSPICSATWAILTVVSWRAHPTRVLLCGLITILCIAPWTIRNHLVFGELVPIKSNAGFDAWQGNVFDEDGILDSTTFHTHPCYNENEHRVEIRKRGEVAYSKHLGRLFGDWVVAHPADYARKVINRIKASTVCFWIQMDQRVSIFWRVFPLVVLASPWLLIPCGAVYCKQVPRLYWIGLAWMVLYLMPYWAITYYDRYGAPLVGIKALLVIIITATFHKRRSEFSGSHLPGATIR